MLEQTKKISKAPKTSRAAMKNQISKLTDRISFIENKLKEIVNENSLCPVTLNVFDLENPPFNLRCGHNLSLQTLRHLEIKKVKFGEGEVNGMQCPLCRKHFLFATLNTTYFKILNLTTTMENKNFNQRDLNSREEEIIRKLRNFPKVFAVKGGIFSSRS